MKKNDFGVVLATFNFRVPCDPAPYDWANRRDRVRELIKADGFEIFGVQEAVRQQLADVLEGTSFAKIGGGRDDFLDGGEHSCIIYDTARFRLLDGGTFALSEQPDVPGSKSWGTACPRIASWGKFHDVKSGKDFCYYNTHLDHVSELARVEGIKMVVAHAGRNCSGLPLVLTGDFNAYPDSETYKIAATLLRDAGDLSETGRRGPFVTFQNYGRPVRREEPIDYIFVSEGVVVNSFVTDDRKFLGDFASDHYPVFAELVF